MSNHEQPPAYVRRIRLSLDALRSRKKLWIGVPIAVFILGAIIEVFLIQNPYRAEVVLAVVRPRIGGEEISSRLPAPLHERSYENMVVSTGVKGEVLSRLTQEGAWGDEESPRLEDFVGSLGVGIETVDETVRPVQYAPFLTLSAVAKTSELARKTADTWAEVAIESVQELQRMQIVSPSRSLASEESRFREELDEIWQSMAEEEAEWNLESLNAKLKLKIDMIVSFTENLSQTKKELELRSRRLATIQENLAKEKPAIDLFKAPSDDVYWTQNLDDEDSNQADLENLRQKGMMHQEVNSVYASLKRTMYDAMADIESYKAEIDFLEQELERLEKEKDELQEVIEQHQLRQRRLKKREELLNGLYTEVARVQQFVGAIEDLTQTQAEGEATLVGLNRLTDQTHVVEDFGFLGGKERVVLVTILTGMLAMGYVVSRPLLADFLGTGR